MPSKTYKSWQGMYQRCYNPNNPDYPNYGGRGITVCESWQRYSNFKRDMGKKPDGLTLDRKDNDGNYEPGNCRWATKKEQNNNRRERRIGYLISNNISGLSGVHYNGSRTMWEAYGNRSGTRERLYRGRDFLEACCARKSWELRA